MDIVADPRRLDQPERILVAAVGGRRPSRPVRARADRHKRRIRRVPSADAQHRLQGAGWLTADTLLLKCSSFS